MFSDSTAAAATDGHKEATGHLAVSEPDPRF